MWPAVRAELRLRRTWVRAGRAAAVVAVVALVLMPVNGSVLVSGHPEAQAPEEYFYDWYDRSLWQYSSGFLINQLVVLAVGAALVFDGPVRSPRVLAAKAVLAAGAGVLLAAVNAAVAIPVAALIVGPPPVRDLQRAGWEPGTYLTNVLGDPPALLALAVLLGAFPLYALIGVGLAVLVPRRWVLVSMVLVWWVGSFWVGVYPLHDNVETAPFWQFLLLPQWAGLDSIMLTSAMIYHPLGGYLPPEYNFRPEYFPPPEYDPPLEYAHGGLLLGALGFAVLLNAAAWCVLARRRAGTGAGG